MTERDIIYSPSLNSSKQFGDILYGQDIEVTDWVFKNEKDKSA